LLIDADAGLANTDLLLGLVPEFDLDDWLQGACATKELLCAGPHGLSLLIAGASAASRLTLHGLLTGRGPEPLAGVFDAFELIIVDLGAGVSEPVLRMASHCESVWLVATPEPTSLADAYATAKKLFEIDPERSLELVINRFVGQGTAARTHESLNRLLKRFLGKSIALRGSVPEDPALIRSVALQSPVVLARGRSESARRVELMAESLIEEQRSLSSRAADPTCPVGPS
jgi:flagellar biosynthesis protein FlhG